MESSHERTTNVVKRHNVGKKVLSGTNTMGFQSPQYPAQNGHPQRQLTNYVPPPPPYTCFISQFSHAPMYTPFYRYPYYSDCYRDQFTLPLQLGTTMIPPQLPPPQPPSAPLPPTPNSQSNISAIDEPSGDVGQYFGALRPMPPQL